MNKCGLKRLFSALLFPDDIKCIVCDAELSRDTKYGLCDCCKIESADSFCLKCGRVTANLADYCIECQHREWSFGKARAAVLYEGNAKELVHRLKYGNSRYLAQKLAQFMADVYYENRFEADVLTFVPMHDKKRRKRGYNQSKLIADNLGEILNLPCEDLFKKVVNTKNLARLKREERAEVIKGSFVFAGSSVKGKRVLLIDDVFTTGATSEECAKILLKEKPAFVDVLTFATSRIIPLLY